MKYKEYIEQRKESIPETAFKLFASRGIEPVSMQEIADASDCGIASLYRYYGTKLKLVIEIGALKWRQYAALMEAEFADKKIAALSAYEEFEFYLDCYIELYRSHKPLLKFNADFDLYILHEHASSEALADYYDSVKHFSDKFHALYQKALADNTLRTDISERELYFSSLYSMLTLAARFAGGTIYPSDSAFDCIAVLKQQKQMLMLFASKKTH